MRKEVVYSVLMDVKKILAELSVDKKSDRGRQSVYVSKATWERFKKAAKAAGPSLVLEKLMTAFCDEAEKKK